MDFEISIIDLCDGLGGMHNAVKFLIKLFEKYESEIYVNKITESSRRKRYINHRIINDKYDIIKGDSDGFYMDGGGSYSYGYLRT